MRTRLGIMVLVILALLTWIVQAEEPVKAYKGLVFEESRTEMTRRITADKSLQGNTYSCFTKIGNEQYGLQFDFNEDRLYLIKFTSNYPLSPRVYGPQHFDTVLTGLETLRQEIETQYGQPHFVDDITFVNVRDEDVACKYLWAIDNIRRL